MENLSLFGGSDEDGAPLHHADSMTPIDIKQLRSYNKVPEDPWCIRARWKKSGLYMPGTIPPGSTHSSTNDLRRQSVASLSTSNPGSVHSHETSASPDSAHPPKAPSGSPDQQVTVFMDIQLYEMDPGCYLVDFKCAGYQNPEGNLVEEKDVTSPFPFLDLACKLIIQLAEAD